MGAKETVAAQKQQVHKRPAVKGGDAPKKAKKA